MKILLIIIIFLLASSCAFKETNSDLRERANFYEDEKVKQGTAIISAMASASRRLHDISWRVFLKNKEFCREETIDAFGLMVGEQADLPNNMRNSYTKVFNMRPNNIFPVIVSVANGAPAYIAGVKEGDFIISINGVAVKNDLRSLLKKAAIKKAIELKLLRGEEHITVQIKSKEICGYAVQPLVSPFPTAYADGSKIFVTLAALNFIDDDSELAFIIGHELIHNVLHFKGSKVGEENFLPISINDKPVIRKIGDVFVWESSSKESEADIEGLELSSIAGYDPFSAANYFRRLSIYLPELIEDSFFRVHPGNARRALDLEQKARELLVD